LIFYEKPATLSVSVKWFARETWFARRRPQGQGRSAKSSK